MVVLNNIRNKSISNKIIHFSGFLVEFFSYPVIAGFTSAAAIQIASSQVKGLLGLPGKANDFLEAWETVIHNISEIKLWDSVLGFSSIIILIIMQVSTLLFLFIIKLIFYLTANESIWQ